MNISQRSPKRVLEDLAVQAQCEFGLSYDQFHHAQSTGKPVPEYCLPGRMLMKQSPEVREKLKSLTSDDIANSIPFDVFMTERPKRQRKRFVSLS